jgi:hypothetical protein
MHFSGECDCGGEHRFQFKVSSPTAASNSDTLIPKAVCACTKCLLVAKAHRAEILLFETVKLSSTGGALLDRGIDSLANDHVNVVGNEDISVSDLESIIICPVCKLCVGFRFPQIGFTALSRRVMNLTTVEPSVPSSTLSKYCTQYFSGTNASIFEFPVSSCV